MLRFISGQILKKRHVKITTSLKELEAEYNNQMTELKKHIYSKRKQYEYFNSRKDNLKVVEILMSIDYSENYVNKEQQVIRSAHFGHKCLSIFTA